MGVYGFDEIQDGVTMQGWARGSATVAGDNDWNLHVAPALKYSYLLENPHLPINADGMVECEVQPAQYLQESGLPVKDPALVNKLLGNPDGKWVTVVGTWSIDKSHTVDGEVADFPGDSANGKTEIHPIISILVEQWPADNSSREVDFLVLAEDVSNAPHTLEDRQGVYEVPIPPGSSFTIATEIYHAASRNVTTSDTSRVRTVRLEVRSGKPNDLKGFYYAHISLPGFTLLTYLLSRGCDPTKGVRDLMDRARTTSLRALFKQLDARALMPARCAGVQSQIAALQSKIADVAQRQKADLQDGQKPKQDPNFQELQKEMADLLAQVEKLSKQAHDLGCDA